VERTAEHDEALGQATKLLEDMAAVVDPAYLVGGSVRDLLMGRACHDYDFATPLHPDEVEARVRAAGRHPYLVGKKFGTVAFKLEGRMVEVTTFRAETYEPGSRRPNVSYLADLGDDLARRDFTINAIAMHNDQIIDPFDGRSDIEARVVRAVGVAKDRFREDPLRMLRAARFAAQLDFSVEADTVAAMAHGAHRILTVARERWMAELDRLLVGPGAIGALRLLADTGLLRYLLPELQLQVGYDQDSRWHDRALWDHTLGVVAGVPQDVTLRWAALMHDIGKPFARVEKPGRATYVGHERISTELVERTALYLRWPTARREEVMDLVLHHMDDDSPLREADDAAKAPVAREEL
jgi:tRNA nucleotidyltransferase/poly(A) polymerase